MIGSDVPSPETIVLTGGRYLKEQDVTYFGSKFQVSQLHHAIIILLANSQPLHVNTTAYIFNKVVMYSDQYRGYQLSVDVHFNGNTASLFIPEHYFMKTGEYYLTFTIPKRHETELSMAVKPTVCIYLDEDISRPTWDTSGCKVSPNSSMSSTVCLCNHLTTFTTNPL
ncbi:polycystin-1-like protein 3 [Ptychodera flava]|uniref:polycystin-1-like protein 3 n=1 Tax=Ptychodera flava TaxID=63121 RepID=UPI00396A69E3